MEAAAAPLPPFRGASFYLDNRGGAVKGLRGFEGEAALSSVSGSMGWRWEVEPLRPVNTTEDQPVPLTG